MAKVTIVFNGNEEEVEESTTILDLVERSGVEPRYCAVEVNMEIVPRAHYASHHVLNGDRVEIVTLVGGG